MLLQFNKDTWKITKRKTKIKHICVTRTYIQEWNMFFNWNILQFYSRSCFITGDICVWKLFYNKNARLINVQFFTGETFLITWFSSHNPNASSSCIHILLPLRWLLFSPRAVALRNQTVCWGKLFLCLISFWASWEPRLILSCSLKYNGWYLHHILSQHIPAATATIRWVFILSKTTVKALGVLNQ